jgi:hypothetical protein
MDSSVEYIYKTTKPLTFLAWLESQPIISKDYNANLKSYQNYVAEWHKFNRSSEEQIQDSFASLYIDMLRDISLTYATEEEKRFISNCSLTNPEELDIVLPFFIQKLKAIILYYNKKREDLKKKVKDLPTKGSATSVSSVIRDIIFEEIESENLQVFLGTRFKVPTFEAINENLNIEVEEIYDDTEYANRPYEVTELDVDPQLFLDFKNAIITAIKKYPVFLEGLKTNFSFNLNLSGTELNLLKQRDFTNYFISDDVDDLKLQLYKNLTVKFMGCDMYYLSTGSTTTDFVSGKLFSTAPTDGNVVLNPLNKRYPTSTLIPSLSDIYTAYICGGFFVPSKVSALLYNAPDKRYTIDESKLIPNKVYVFADPGIIGNASDYQGDISEQYPLVYEIDVSWNKFSSVDGFRYGDVSSSSYNQLFYPYESLSQEVIKNKQGISTPFDNIDFWEGDKDTVWSNSDIWPNLDRLERLPIDSRLKSLLIDEGYMVKWFVDIFGNEYGLYKKNVETIDEKRTSSGVIYVKTTDGKVKEFTEALGDVLLKLPANVVNEIKSAKNIFVTNKTILIETENYAIIDIVNYDPVNQKYISSLYPGFYRQKSFINPYIEKLIGYTYRPDNNSLYLCFTSLLPELSSSNYKSIIPQIYKVDIDQLRVLQVYPGKNFTTIYSLSSNSFTPPEIDIRFIESGHFSHKEKYGLYNLTYIAYNLNNVPFIVNEKFYSTPYEDPLITTNPVFFKPFYYIYDTNFSIVERKDQTGFTSTYTDYAGSYNIEKFKFFHESEPVINREIITTNLINTTGSKIIDFNWNAQTEKSIFIGCSGFKLEKIGDAIQLATVNSFILNDGIFYDLLYFNHENRSFVCRGRDLSNSNLTTIEFNVVELPSISRNLPPLTSVFCETPTTSLQKITLNRFDDVMAVGAIDPVLLNSTGSTILHLDWAKYNNVNIFFGCSGYKLQFTEDIIYFPYTNVFFTENNVWYDLINFNIEDRTFFVKARLLPDTNNDVIEIYIGETILPTNDGTYTLPFTGVFCESIFSIFRTVKVERVGSGEGIVTSIPGCVDCGTNCEFLYPINSTITFKASAIGESIFSGWLGSDCEGSVGDCTFTVTENVSVSAVFNKLDRYDLTIFVNNSSAEVRSLDGEILCPGVGECTYNFLAGTPITLSASPAPVGTTFKGFIGGRCDPGSNICSFFINRNESLTALYEPSFSTLLIQNRFEKNENEVTDNFWILGTGDGETLPAEFRLTTNFAGFEESSERGVEICGHNEVWGAGTLLFSLCTYPVIHHFHYYNLPTGIFGSLSATPSDKYLFGGYSGDRCEGVIRDFCVFGVKGNNNITGVFTPPFYSFKVENYSWLGTMYSLGNVKTFDSSGKIYCPSYQIDQPCVSVYLSGTRISLATIPEQGSFVHLLCGSGGFFLSGSYITGLTGLSGVIGITENTTLSVFSETLAYENITIYKQYIGDTDLKNSVTIIPGPSATPSFTLQSSASSITLSYPKNTILRFVPIPSLFGKPLYTIGASGLNYEYTTNENSGLSFDPDIVTYTQGDTLLGVSNGLRLEGTSGPLAGWLPPLEIQIGDSTLVLTDSDSVTSVFIPNDFTSTTI